MVGDDDSVVIVEQLLCYVVAQGSARLYLPKSNVPVVLQSMEMYPKGSTNSPLTE